MKPSQTRLSTLTILLCLIPLFIQARYSYSLVNKSTLNGMCTADLKVYISGDAGPFDVSLEIYDSNDLDNPEETHLLFEDVPSGVYTIPSLGDNKSYKLIIYDYMCCCEWSEWVDLNCDCSPDPEFNVYYPCHEEGRITLLPDTDDGGIIQYYWYSENGNSPIEGHSGSSVYNLPIGFTYCVDMKITEMHSSPPLAQVCTLTECFSFEEEQECDCQIELNPYEFLSRLYIEYPKSCNESDNTGLIHIPILGAGWDNFLSGYLHPLTLTWSNGVTQFVPNESYLGIKELTAGEYGLTITDDMGCSVEQSIELMPEQDFGLSIEEVVPECDDIQNGSISILYDVSNATSIWSNGATNVTSIEDLDDGEYGVTVTYTETGCEYIESFYIEPLVSPIEGVEISYNFLPCRPDQKVLVDINITGGVSVFEINIESQSGNNNESISTDSHNQAIRLKSDFYTFTIVDHCGNEFTLQEDLPIDNTPLTEPEFVVTDYPCNWGIGHGTIIPQGGVPPYNIIQNGQPIPDIVTSGLNVDLFPEGNIFIIEDHCGNELTFNATDAVPVPHCMLEHFTDPIVVQTNGNNNGSINLQISNSCNSMLTYAWSGEGVNNQTGNIISDLAPGSYCYTVTNEEGCSLNGCINILDINIVEGEILFPYPNINPCNWLIPTPNLGIPTMITPNIGECSDGFTYNFTNLTAGANIKFDFFFATDLGDGNYVCECDNAFPQLKHTINVQVPINPSSTSGFHTYYFTTEGEFSDKANLIQFDHPDGGVYCIKASSIGLCNLSSCTTIPTKFCSSIVLPLEQDEDCPESLSLHINNNGNQIDINSTLVSDDHDDSKPIVVLGPLSSNEEDFINPVIGNITPNNFSIHLSELEYDDNIHVEENISYLAADPGYHELNGITMYAGEVEKVTDKYKIVRFPKPFKNIPVVILSQTTSNERTMAIPEIYTVNRYYFRVKLVEPESEDGIHGFENLSYMAFEQGQGEINGKRILVKRPSTKNLDHNWLDIDFNASQNLQKSNPFQYSPLFFAYPQSAYGLSDPAVLRYQNLNPNGVSVKLQEEQSMDQEIDHTKQFLGFVVLESNRNCDCEDSSSGNGFQVELIPPSCEFNDGVINVTVSNGVSPFNMILTSGSDTIESTDGLFENIVLGNYGLTISDSSGCEWVDSISVNTSGLYLENSIVENIQCLGTVFNVEIVVPNGQAPYTYQWSNGSTQVRQNDLSSGIYHVTVTDSGGCTGVKTFNLKKLYVSSNIEDATCGLENGSMEAVVVGTAPFTYAWSNGSTKHKIENLAPGVYSVIVTDAAGCTFERSGMVSGNGQISFDIGYPFCNANNGSIEAVFDGVPPFTYHWSNGSSGASIKDLAPGTYEVTASDSNGCSGIETITLINTSSINISDSGGNEGLIDGRFIPAGTTIDWAFDPVIVTDQLIISSIAEGTIINTGRVTKSTSVCMNDANDCSQFFLGDIPGQDLDLIEGSGHVLEGFWQDTCYVSGNLIGTFTTQASSYVSIEVIGSLCEGDTAWSMALSCSGNSQSLVMNNSNSKQEFIFTQQRDTESRNYNTEDKTKEIIIAPNPSSGLISITSNSNTNNKIKSLSIYNSKGESIKRLENLNLTSFEVDLSVHSSGLYFVTILLENGDLITEKLILR